jgi:hypothetical protein
MCISIHVSRVHAHACVQMCANVCRMHVHLHVCAMERERVREFLETVLVHCAFMYECMMECTCARMYVYIKYDGIHVRGQERMPGMRRWEPHVH